MKLWLITYDGVQQQFGGTAIVSARTFEEAVQILSKDPRSFGAVNAVGEELNLTDEPMVLYNDDGDY